MCVVAEATRRLCVIELSIRRRGRRHIIGEWALHRYDGIFGIDKGCLLHFVRLHKFSDALYRLPETLKVADSLMLLG